LTVQVTSFGDSQRFDPGGLSTRRDEVGALCREFDRMTVQLQNVHEGLRESNRELEIEIIEHEHATHQLQQHQERLRDLSSELVVAEERERRHLAMELHDRIGQALAVLQMKIELLLQKCSPGPVENEGRKIITAVESIIQDSRSLTFEISPPVLHELGLGPALEWLAEEMSGHSSIHMEVTDRMPISLEEGARTLVFRAVRELLHNVVKHSRARNAWVTLEQIEGDLRVTVRDDGVGFPGWHGEMGKQSHGFGLFSIRERFLSLGGMLQMESTVEGGALVTLSLPLQPKAGKI
jgi:signal transduction histidine kinase